MNTVDSQTIARGSIKIFCIALNLLHQCNASCNNMCPTNQEVLLILTVEYVLYLRKQIILTENIFCFSDFPWSVDHRFLLLDRHWDRCHFAKRKLPAGRIFAGYHGSTHFAHSQWLSPGIYHHRRRWNILGNHHYVFAATHGVHRSVLK